MLTRLLPAALVLTNLAALSSDSSACEPRVRYTMYRPATQQVVYVQYRPAVAPVVPPPPTIVQPSAFEASAGATVTLSQNFLGSQAGFVLLNAGDAVIQCEVLGWDASKVTFKLPSIGVKQPISTRLDVVLTTGQVAVSHSLRLLPPPVFTVHEAVPASPAPVAGLRGPSAKAETAGMVLRPSSATFTVGASVSE